MSSINQDYQQFLQSKAPRVNAIGKEPMPVNPILFDWQTDIVKWAIRRGCAAIFADCGLGKSFQQIEWIRQMITKRGLIVCPLSVAEQTIAEGVKLGIEITYKLEPDDSEGIWITNYDRLHKFDPALFDAIVLDESSILKSLDGKIRTMLLEKFTAIPYRLCCTATPAPNDLTELTNHAEFLGVMSRQEMLATFFVHDSEDSGDRGWRLKKHARGDFWRWVAQWAVYIRKPSDLGYDDGKFVLPPLSIEEKIVASNYIPEGQLFPGMVGGVSGRAKARRSTMDARIEYAANFLKNAEGQWLVWCGLNPEGQGLAKMLGDEAVLIEGATKDNKRIQYLNEWKNGDKRVMISKTGIFGFGLNFQHCNNILYLGLDDSFEKWYQSVRRCWRFGQEKPVNVVVVTSDAESQIVDNVKRKERQADEMAAGIVDAMRDAQIESVKGFVSKRDIYKMKTIETENYKLMLGDCVERIKEIPDKSIGLSIFSPPFAKLYTYSPSDRDMGNCKNFEQFFEHFRFLIPEIMRVTKPGRTCAVHCQDIALTRANDGVIGRRDFSRDVSIAFEQAGWIYQGRITIQKNPQAQAIRTKARNLMFVQKNKDSAVSRPALADYILIFENPGENEIPVKTDITNEEWIKLAHPGWLAKVSMMLDAGVNLNEVDPSQFLSDLWSGINESDTLNYQAGRENDDERHICALQLETIRRCVRLWSNKGETIASFFMGIGSEGYVAMEQERKFVGIELKESYFNQAVENIRGAVKQENLFSLIPESELEEVA